MMIHKFIHYSEIMTLIQADIPWTYMAAFLNRIIDVQYASQKPPEFPNKHSLPEDYTRQGLLYGWNYITSEYLDEAGLHHDEQQIETKSMTVYRRQRIHYLE